MNKLYSIALIILAVLTLLSLTLNILTIATLMWVRDVALEEVVDAIVYRGGKQDASRRDQRPL
jgi:hypothetical protein